MCNAALARYLPIPTARTPDSVRCYNLNNEVCLLRHGLHKPRRSHSVIAPGIAVRAGIGKLLEEPVKEVAVPGSERIEKP
jgi:hypothetical protein